jgi:lipopolysaccharide transport system permease protein
VLDNVEQVEMTSEIIIRSPRAFSSLDVRELWRYRALLNSIVRRRLKAEFNQQYLAYVWPVFRPLLMVLLFTIFRNLSEARTGVSIPYALYVYSGLIFWFLFTESVLEASMSIKQNAVLIKKVYFPKILFPMSVIIANFVIFSISIVPLIGMMMWFGVYPGWSIFILPIVMIQLALLAFGVGCIFASLGLENNDWDKFLGFILYLGLFISPVIYALSMLPEKIHLFYSLNPMTGLLMTFRTALFSDFPLGLNEWMISSFFVVIIAFLGLAAFQYSEKHIVDKL